MQKATLRDCKYNDISKIYINSYMTMLKVRNQQM